jgi:hypothetical protein
MEELDIDDADLDDVSDVELSDEWRIEEK